MKTLSDIINLVLKSHTQANLESSTCRQTIIQEIYDELYKRSVESDLEDTTERLVITL